jgi:hypothetical protein
MKSFNTDIYFNEIEYSAEITGTYTIGELATLDSPRTYPSFTIEHIYITPNDTVGTIDLKSPQYEWSLTEGFLKDLEHDYFTLIKEEDYAGDYYD